MIKLLAAILLLVVVCVATPVLGATAEVCMPASGTDSFGAKNVSVWTRLGQRLTIPNRTVTELGYAVWRVGVPTGDVTISMRDMDDEVLFSQVWGDASELPETGVTGYCRVVLSSPLQISQEVRICVEYYGGNCTDYCIAGYYVGNKVTGEWYTNYLHDGRWHDIGEAEEGAYCYTYIDEGGDPVDGDDGSNGINWLLMGACLGIVVTVVGGGFLLRRLGRTKRGGDASDGYDGER